MKLFAPNDFQMCIALGYGRAVTETFATLCWMLYTGRLTVPEKEWRQALAEVRRCDREKLDQAILDVTGIDVPCTLPPKP